MLKRMPLFFAALLVWETSCKSVQGVSGRNDDGKIQVTFVQVNDVYEIGPVDNGRSGGLARVATLKKRYADSNRNTFLVMAGDFLSPSVFNTLRYQGKRVRGKQMVESLNSAGLDYAVFGNHEFDLEESELQERLNESAFRWVSSNAFHEHNGRVKAFERRTDTGWRDVPVTITQALKDGDGTTATIGFFGLTIPSNRRDYVNYTDAMAAARQAFSELSKTCDAVVAITHQLEADDIALAQELPGLAAIIGGHEHDMRIRKVGDVYITKAHANARTAYVIRMQIDKVSKRVSVHPELVTLDERVPPDSATNQVVSKWLNIAKENMASAGFRPENIVYSRGEPLDGRETETRESSTNLTRHIAAAMSAAAPDAQVVVYNAGMLRLDDVLTAPVSEYELLRALPFGGGMREVDINGKFLRRILLAGVANKGTGGFLHFYAKARGHGATTDEQAIEALHLDSSAIYRVAFCDYLLTGLESNLGFLQPDNPEIIRLYDAPGAGAPLKADVRHALISYLRQQNQP